MSTSLSRQLSQLRSSAPPSASASDALFSSGPFLLDSVPHDLDLDRLRYLSRAAFDSLALDRPALLRARRRMALDEMDAHVEKEEEEEEDWKSELLLLLSPSALKASTQIVLQWMITKHKVRS